MVAFRFSHIAIVITSLERDIKTDRKNRLFVLEKCTSFQSINIIHYQNSAHFFLRDQLSVS